LLQREEEEMKICSLDEYEIFDDDEEVASLLNLPLHYKKHTLGGSTTARELYVMGKADNLQNSHLELFFFLELCLFWVLRVVDQRFLVALAAGYREPQIQPWDGKIIRTTGSR
jgi:hypothetical protein